MQTWQSLKYWYGGYHSYIRKAFQHIFFIISRPRVQSNNTSRVRFTVILHKPIHSRFYHTHVMYKWNWDGSCLVKLIYFVLHIFQIRNLPNWVDESRWNMPSKETWLGGAGGRCCCYVVTIVVARSRIVTSRNLNTYHDFIQCMDGGDSKIILTPSKSWGVCDNILSHVGRNENDKRS